MEPKDYTNRSIPPSSSSNKDHSQNTNVQSMPTEHHHVEVVAMLQERTINHPHCVRTIISLYEGRKHSENILKTISKIIVGQDCLNEKFENEKFENLKKKYDDLIMKCKFRAVVT